MSSNNVRAPSQARIAEVVKTVCEARDMHPRDVRSDNRTRPITGARWEIWRQLYEAGFGFAPIARAWGCDHASVLYARDCGWTIDNANPERIARKARRIPKAAPSKPREIAA